METLIDFFRNNPVIPVFLTVGLGFWLGKLRFRSFALGSVAATLVIGVVIGQMKIVVPDILKNVFFLLFLFSIGYSVGPQFFRAFRGPGLKQVCFAVVATLVCAGLVVGASLIMGYSGGVATGLYAGSQTVSACLGMVSDTIREMPMDESKREYMLMIIPACYAVTYVFGTIGSAWFLSSVALGMMGGLKKVLGDVARIEQAMDNGEGNLGPGEVPAGRPFSFRAYEASVDFFSQSHTVKETEEYFSGKGERIFVERARIGGKIVDVDCDTVISKGDILVIGGRLEVVIEAAAGIGPEVADPELLNFGAEKTPVTLSRSGARDMTFGKLRKAPYMHGVMVAGIRRNGLSLPLRGLTELYPGDVVTLVGWPREVSAAAEKLGYADRQTDTTDMVFVGLGIAAGCILGALSIKVKGIPLSLGMSVGALISGLLLGWWRTRNPSFGRIPAPVVWVFDNLGINMFIGVIGITAGASFLFGLKEAGWSLFLVGAALTIVGLIINVFLARKLFRFETPEVLGCVAGARLSVASIGAIRDTLHSDVPNLGYTVTYAVANVVMVFCALFVLSLV